MENYLEVVLTINGIALAPIVWYLRKIYLELKAKKEREDKLQKDPMYKQALYAIDQRNTLAELLFMKMKDGQ